MIVPLALLALATGALAQQNAEFISGLVEVLTEQNLTTLLEVAVKANSTPVGAAFFEALDKGPLVLFAPINEAFVGVPQNISSSAEVLANVLAYHILPGNYSGIQPTNTSSVIGSTLLNDSALVQLEGNKSQVISWRLDADGNQTIIENQNTFVTVLGTLNYENITIYTVNSVIDVPGNFTAVAAQNNFTRTAPLFADIAANLTGYTIFAPSDVAINLANDTFDDIAALDESVLSTIVGNHYVPGSTVYSTQLSDGQVLTTASGGSLTVTTNATGVFVTGGPSTVRVTKSDALVRNGVVHVVDGLFIYAETNTEAASSAVAAASSAVAAATSAVAGGPVGAVPSAVASATAEANPGSGAMLSTSVKGASVLVAVACVALAL